MPRPPAPPKPRVNWKLAVRVVAWGALLTGMAWGGKQVRSFLVTDPRFRLDCEIAEASCSTIEVRGAVYTNKARVKSVFAQDFGRSLVQIPLAERRRHLLAIDWVKSASILRVWPNRLMVSIAERRPAAFAKLPNALGRFRMTLIDDDGVLLALPQRVRFHLPVISGINEDQTEDERKIRVQAMKHLIDDLGPQAKDVSEVNASSIQDMRMVVSLEGRAAELWMGDQHYRQRYLNFLSHYPQIRKSSERASVFDLRLEDRILAR